MSRTALIVAVFATTALLPACHRAKPNKNADTHGFVPPPTMPAKPMAGQTPLTSLDAYVGHDPHDPVDGIEFFDRTEVATALVAAIHDERVRHTFREGHGAARPIYAQGHRIAAWGCSDGDDCAAGSWTFFIDDRSGKGEACFHTPAMGATSHWYAGDKPVTRPGDCPTSAA